MIALSICWIERPGLFASRNSRLIVAPGVSPLPAFEGTAPGIVQLPPPVVLQESLFRPAPAPGRHWAFAPGTLAVPPGVTRFGLVQPIVSKPTVRTVLCTAATPTSAPK